MFESFDKLFGYSLWQAKLTPPSHVVIFEDGVRLMDKQRASRLSQPSETRKMIALTLMKGLIPVT
jgi:hypothetical protein